MASQLTLTRRQAGWAVLLLVVALTWFVLPASLRNRVAPVAQAATFTVTNTDDDGPGSLRQAIVTSNLNMGPSANVNYRAMVCAFITSHEYQRRFGQVISRSNQDCPP